MDDDCMMVPSSSGLLLEACYCCCCCMSPINAQYMPIARGSFTIVYNFTWCSAVWNMTARDSRLCLSI